jgi:hypothetical protein
MYAGIEVEFELGCLCDPLCLSCLKKSLKLVSLSVKCSEKIACLSNCLKSKVWMTKTVSIRFKIVSDLTEVVNSSQNACLVRMPKSFKMTEI